MEEVTGGRVGLEFLSRVQLRAIFSGLVVAGGCLAICLGLSWSIGLSTFQPTTAHARGLLLGNAIWGAIAIWISLFFGAYVAAAVGRSVETVDGILHGLVVWGALAALFGFFLLRLFSGMSDALLLMTTSPETAAAQVPLEASATVLRFAHTIGITTWLYWAGVVGGLLTAILGGWVGVSDDARIPRFLRRRTSVPVRQSPPPVRGPSVPQPV